MEQREIFEAIPFPVLYLIAEKNNEDILKLLDSNLDKVSSDIISKLNKDVFDTGNDVIMVLRDLNQWKGILSRGKFQTLTYDKRADLLKQLSSYLSTLKQYFNTVEEIKLKINQ